MNQEYDQVVIPTPEQRQENALPAAMLLFVAVEQLSAIAGVKLEKRAVSKIKRTLQRKFMSNPDRRAPDRVTFTTALIGAQVAYETVMNLQHGTHEPEVPH